jgi:hypothetical protein
VKEITITVPTPITVRVSGEFAPPEGTNWHCVAPFVADPGGDALKDQGCTVGTQYDDFSIVPGEYRGQNMCQWDHTNEDGTGPKVEIPWLGDPPMKCERFVEESTDVTARESQRQGGDAPGCTVAEKLPPAWPPGPNPNPYELGDCILDWHEHFVVTETGSVTLRVVDGLELKPSVGSVGKYDICEDFEVTPVDDTDPNPGDNTLQECFELNIVSAVGGLAELPEVSDSPGRNYVVLAGGLAAGALVALLAITAGGWYVRRRWLS